MGQVDSCSASRGVSYVPLRQNREFAGPTGSLK